VSEPITFFELTLGINTILAKTEKKMIVISQEDSLLIAITTM